MRRKLSTVGSCHLRPLLYHRIERSRLQRPLRHIAPAIDLPKYAATFDLRRVDPGIERLDRATGERDNFVLVGAGRFGTAKVNGAGGGTAVGFDRWLDDNLFYTQSGNLTALAAARGKSDHQDRQASNIAQDAGAAGRQHLSQHVAGHRLDALAFSWPRRGPDGEADSELEGRGGEGAGQGREEPVAADDQAGR